MFALSRNRITGLIKRNLTRRDMRVQTKDVMRRKYIFTSVMIESHIKTKAILLAHETLLFFLNSFARHSLLLQFTFIFDHFHQGTSDKSSERSNIFALCAFGKKFTADRQNARGWGLGHRPRKDRRRLKN